MYKLLTYDNDIVNLLKNGKTSHLFTFDIVDSMHELVNYIYDKQYDLLIINHKMLDPAHMDVFADVKTKIIVAFDCYDTQGLLLAVKIGAADVFEKPVDIVFLKQIVLKHLAGQLQSSVTLDCGYSFLRSKSLIVNEHSQYPLSNKERLLLEVLSKNMNNITSYEEIESYVWQGDFMSSDSLRTLVKTIRKKLPDNSIRTVKGFGYILEVKETAGV